MDAPLFHMFQFWHILPLLVKATRCPPHPQIICPPPVIIYERFLLKTKRKVCIYILFSLDSVKKNTSVWIILFFQKAPQTSNGWPKFYFKKLMSSYESFSSISPYWQLFMVRIKWFCFLIEMRPPNRQLHWNIPLAGEQKDTTSYVELIFFSFFSFFFSFFILFIFI